MPRRFNKATQERIRRIWKGGAYDTMQLAERFRATEPQIYNIIAQSAPKPAPKPIPQSAKLPFAGKPTGLPLVRPTALVKPIPPYAGYDRTERW